MADSGVPLNFNEPIFTKSADTPDIGELVSPRFSEDELALRFTREFADDLRYVARWNKWLRFDGKRWQEDEILKVFDRARKICRAASAECDLENEKERATARQLNSAKTVYSVERLARSDPHHSATKDQWDSDQCNREFVLKKSLCRKPPKFGDRKCLPKASTSLVGLPNAKFF